MLAILKAGKGLYWGVPKNVDQAYLEQLEGEQLRKVINKRTGRRTWEWVKVGRRGDHLKDCECMQMVMACIKGLLIGRSDPEVEEGDVAG